MLLDISMIPWYKALHIFFMVAWMAGLFYLPRLFIYNAASSEVNVKSQLNIMQRRLWLFVTPFALLTALFGILIIVIYGKEWFKVSIWLHIKIALALSLYVYHIYLYVLMRKFLANKNTHSPKFYRFLNESPVFILLAIVILAVVKPYF